MQDDLLLTLPRLTDEDLLAALRTLIIRERDAGAEIVAHLAELDTRDIHLRAGYPSLYVYCREVLGLTEWEAYNRIEVARAARRFPVVLELLSQGAVSLTAVRLLSPHLTATNHREVLAEARGKKKAEVEVMVARLSPQADARSLVRRIPSPATAHRLEALAGDATPIVETKLESFPAGTAAPSESELSATITDPAASMFLELRSGSETAVPIPRATTTPLSPDRYKYQVTIGAETLEKIRLAKDMLGHAIPSGDDGAILDRAFTALLAELAKKKFAGTVSPGTPARKEVTTAAMRPAAPRTPSAAVKRAVGTRDLGRCAFVGEDGHRCNERRFVEFHHVDPYALGAEATVDGIQLRCRSHNDYEGRLYFGRRRPVAGGGADGSAGAGTCSGTS